MKKSATSFLSRRNQSDPPGALRPRGGSDFIYIWTLRAVAALFSAILLAFVYSIVHQSWPAWTQHGLTLITGTKWNPAASIYGALPLILDTVISTAVALLFAVPIGLGTALVLNFVLPRRLRSVTASLVELLAAIPSVVYGLWGLYVLVPWMTATVEPWLASLTGGGWPFSGDTLGAGIMLASVVLAVMILPTIVAISRDVIAALPKDLNEGALSLGASQSQVLRKVILPSARSGILGAISLGAGRALGETIAVLMVIGGNAQMPRSLFSVGATLASTIATEYTEASPSNLAALGALALILMVLTAAVNAVARHLVRRAGALGA
ncbi:MAG TPA: phosphate ABC transporter permease subunit PstC [Acidimicrobiales bacterium]